MLQFSKKKCQKQHVVLLSYMYMLTFLSEPKILHLTAAFGLLQVVLMFNSENKCQQRQIAVNELSDKTLNNGRFLSITNVNNGRLLSMNCLTKISTTADFCRSIV